MTGRPDSPRSSCQLVKILRVDASGRSEVKSPNHAASRWRPALSSSTHAVHSSLRGLEVFVEFFMAGQAIFLERSWSWAWAWAVQNIHDGEVLVSSLSYPHRGFGHSPVKWKSLAMNHSDGREELLQVNQSPWSKGMVRSPAGWRQKSSSDNPPCRWRLGLDILGLIWSPTYRCIKRAPKPVKRDKLTTSTWPAYKWAAEAYL
jgi:hypothetical protein